MADRLSQLFGLIASKEVADDQAAKATATTGRSDGVNANIELDALKKASQDDEMANKDESIPPSQIHSQASIFPGGGDIGWFCFPPPIPSVQILRTLPAEQSRITELLKDYYDLQGFEDLLEDREKHFEHDREDLRQWLASKQQERKELRDKLTNSGTWQRLTSEVREWEVLEKNGTEEERMAAVCDVLPDIRGRLQDIHRRFYDADYAIRIEIGAVLSARLGFRRDEVITHMYQKQPGPAVETQSANLIEVKRMFGSTGSASGQLPPKPPRFNPESHNRKYSPTSNTFEVTLDYQPSWGDRFEHCLLGAFDAPEHANNRPRAEDKEPEILLPQWFKVLDHSGLLTKSGTFVCSEPTAPRRFKAFMSRKITLEEKVKTLKKDLDANVPRMGSWDKYFHEPDPRWCHQVRREKGGWWKCRTGPDAPLMERRCQLCHHAGAHPNADKDVLKTIEKELERIDKAICEAQKFVAGKDKDEVIRQMRQVDLEKSDTKKPAVPTIFVSGTNA